MRSPKTAPKMRRDKAPGMVLRLVLVITHGPRRSGECAADADARLVASVRGY